MSADTSELRALASDLTVAAARSQGLAELVVAKTAFDIEATSKSLAPVDTGALRSSIAADVQGLSAEIGPTVNYAPYQEFGTSRMAPRPFMGPALERHEPLFTKALEKIATDSIGG